MRNFYIMICLIAGLVIKSHSQTKALPDPNFGVQGIKNINLFDLYQNTNGKAIAADSYGNIFVAGYTGPTNLSDTYYLMKLDGTTGNPISTFGVNGRVVMKGKGIDSQFKLFLTVDKKNNVYLSGTSYGAQGFYIAKFNGTTGAIDANFGTQTLTATYAMNCGVIVDNNNNLYLGGYSQGTSNYDVTVFKLDATFGNLNGNFDGDGKLILDITKSDDYMYTMAFDINNNILIGGNLNNDFGVVKISPYGSLVTSFDTDGVFTIAPNGGSTNNLDELRTICVNAAGDIFLMGLASVSPYSKPAIVKINSSGSIINTFNTNGRKFISTITGNEGFLNAAIDQAGDLYIACGGAGTYIAKIDGSSGSEKTSFDADGFTTTALQPSGMCISLNGIFTTGGIIGTPNKMETIKTDATTGAVVNSFGTNGIVQYLVGYSTESGYCIEKDASGFVYVAGTSQTTTGQDLVIIKYDPVTGQPVTSFDGDGIYILSLGSGDEIPSDIAFDSNNNMYVIGGTSSTPSGVFLLKLDPNTGTPISSFDGDGIAIYNYHVGDLEIDQADNIYMAGYINNATDSDFGIVKINGQTGALDVSFSGDGIQSFPVGTAGESIRKIILDKKGNLFALGNYTSSTLQQIAVAKLDAASGNLINTFGSNGIVKTYVTQFSGDFIRDGGLDSLGNIFVTGYTTTLNTNLDFFVVKIDGTTGTLPSSFDSDGKMIINLSTGSSSDSPTSMAIDHNNDVYILGSTSKGSNIPSYSNGTVIIKLKGTNGSFDLNFGTYGTAYYSDLPFAQMLFNDSKNIFIVGSLREDISVAKINIQPKPTLVYKDAVKTYGNADFNLIATSNSAGAINYQVLNGTGATIDATTGLVHITGAGTVSIQAIQDPYALYDSTQQTITLTINKANLTAKINDASRVYGDPNPTFTFTYTGFVNGDNESVLDKLPTAYSLATGNYPVSNSPYYINPDVYGNDDNYTFTYQSGSLTITPAPLTITADNATRNINEPNPYFSVTYSGFKNGESAGLGCYVNPTCSATISSPAGTYPIHVSNCGYTNTNYTYQFVDGTLTVLNPNAVINSNGMNGFEVYPNPSYGTLFLNLDNDQIEYIKLTNMFGQSELHYSNQINSSMKGLIIMEVKTRDDRYTRKVELR